MCRIVGFIAKQYINCTTQEGILKTMRDTMLSGGPDDAGSYFHKNVALGHRRLSILDLSNHVHQPMSFGQLTITYNGEVYNYKEIRDELLRYGYSFDSNSDTEVILKAFHKWGKDCVSYELTQTFPI